MVLSQDAGLESSGVQYIWQTRDVVVRLEVPRVLVEAIHTVLVRRQP